MTTRDQAERVRRHREAEILGSAGVSGLDVREDEPDTAVIVVYVADESALPSWLADATELDGVALRKENRRFDPL